MNAGRVPVPNAVRVPVPAVTPALLAFVEALGVQFELLGGVPRMTGRLLGWLLVCDPPEQSAAELAEVLHASKGSISTATRSLVRMQLAERIRLPGDRVDRFRARPEAWADWLNRQDGIRALRAVLAQGLEALATEDAPPERRARLEEIDAVYAWWQRRLPQLWQEWEEHRSSGRP